MSRPIEVWTEDVCAALREHWGKMPASRIGKILFGRDDAGNAVIAQAYRMQLGEGWRPPSEDGRESDQGSRTKSACARKKSEAGAQDHREAGATVVTAGWLTEPQPPPTQIRRPYLGISHSTARSTHVFGTKNMSRP